ncbi:MAG: cation:proton antiporter, partial [Gammaproteobacteria bacterium]|nr:cation:proton antiporter [Gammaproteobacteria bacterium]
PEVLAGSLLHLFITSVVFVVLLTFLRELDFRTAVIVAIALSFSSTVVAAKVLEAKRELRAFHGRVAIGILIVQDLVAVALLSSTGNDSPSIYAFAIFALPLLRPLFFYLMKLCGHGELLLLFGLLLALVVGGAGFDYLGLSSELGALAMGLLLAGHERASELSKTLWSLKELFLIGFFLQIGMSGLPSVDTLLLSGLLILLLPFKAILFFFIFLVFKLRARTSFLAALSLATYSEFGLIVAHLGVNQGLLQQDMLVMIAVAVAISFIISAPLNRAAHSLNLRFGPWLQHFESVQRHPDDRPVNLGNSSILIMGMGRVGTGAYDFFIHRNQRAIGMDSDPGKVEQHRKKGRRVVFADAEDQALWDGLECSNLHAILLAMPDIEANTIAAKQLRQANYQGLIGATVLYHEETDLVIKAGADFVYSYYDEVGVGFAEHMWEKICPIVPGLKGTLNDTIVKKPRKS